MCSTLGSLAAEFGWNLIGMARMYTIPAEKKQDPVLRWHLPDRVFFACGACHVLAYAFLDRYGTTGRKALWLKPAPGFTGNHIVVDGGDWIFDYHGYSERDAFFAHTRAKACRSWPGWSASLVELPIDVLVSEAKSKAYDGLWLREPGQFLHNAMPRAEAFLDRFPPPRWPLEELRPRSAAAAPKTANVQSTISGCFEPLPPFSRSHRESSMHASVDLIN